MRIYTTIKQKKEKLQLLALELEILINKTIDFNDINEINFDIFYNGYYWKLKKNVLDGYDKPPLVEIRVTRNNYEYINELSKNERVNETCWVYLKNENKSTSDKMSITIGSLLIMGYNYYKF